MNSGLLLEIKIINNGLFTPTIEKQVRLLLMFGVRDLATVQRLKTKLKQLGIHYTRIASDHWDSFITAFKNCKQSIGNFYCRN
jgi:IS1 family transposase